MLSGKSIACRDNVGDEYWGASPTSSMQEDWLILAKQMFC